MKLWQHSISRRLSEFLAWIDDRESEGHLTRQEHNEIIDAGQKIWDAAGLPNNPDLDDASLAVLQHEYQVMKSKALVICPQLEHEIQTFDQKDSRFWQHPLNIQIREFQELLLDWTDAGKIPYGQRNGILLESYQAYRKADIPRGPDADELTAAAFRQQLHVLKKKTLEICPDLADTIRNLPSSHSL